MRESNGGNLQVGRGRVEADVGRHRPLIGLAVAVAILVATASACDSDPSEPVEAQVPIVVGLDLQEAQDTLQAAGFRDLSSEDARPGESRFQISDRNWIVVGQTPRSCAFVDTDTEVELRVLKDDEDPIQLGVAVDAIPESCPPRPQQTTTAAGAASTGDAPPATEAPTPTTAPAPTLPPETVSQSNAREKAAEYLSFAAFSRTGLIAQLEFEGFSTADATFGVDAVGADWSEQAALKAAEYLDFSSFSRSSLVEQLVFEGFTPAEAEYGVSTTGL